MLYSRHMEELMSRGSFIRRAYEEGARLKAEHGADAVCDLSLGNPVVEPPPRLRDELLALARDATPGAHRYMPNGGFPEAREAVARQLAREHGLPFAWQHVVMTVGAAGGVNVVLKATLEPGDEVVQVAPYFPEYLFYVDNHGGVLRTAASGPDFALDPEAIARVLGPRTRAVLVNSPNNPTGRVYPAASLRALGEVLAAHERRVGRAVFLVADDPYSHIVFDGAEVPSPFAAHRHTILIGSHSKDLAIPGERIGFTAVHPEAEGALGLAQAVAYAVRILGFVNAPALMQRLVARLQGVRLDPATYQRRRDRVLGALWEMGYECVRPEGAFYLFPRAPGGDDLRFYEALARHLVLVVPGTGFGTPGFFRIAYCVEDEVLDRALPRFGAALREIADG
jgi:aspartate aminotransferase